MRDEMQLLKSRIHDPANQLSSLVAHRLVRTGDARKLSTSKIETLTFWLTDRALFSCDRPPATTHPYRLRFYAPPTRCVVEAAPFATLSQSMRPRRVRAAQARRGRGPAPRPHQGRAARRARGDAVFGRAVAAQVVLRRDVFRDAGPGRGSTMLRRTRRRRRPWIRPVASDAPRKRGWLSPRRSRPDVYDFSPRGSEASALSPRGSYDLGSDDDAPSWAPASPPPPRPRSLLAAARSASASPPPPLPPRSGSVVVEPPPAPPSPPAPPDQPPLTTDSASCFVACAPAPAPPERPAAPGPRQNPRRWASSAAAPARRRLCRRRRGTRCSRPSPAPPALRQGPGR